MTVTAIDPRQIADGVTRTVAARGASTRDVVVPDCGPSHDGGPPMLHEQYPGLASSLQLVRRHR